MAALNVALICTTYLVWAMLFSKSLFHRIWSLALFFLSILVIQLSSQPVGWNSAVLTLLLLFDVAFCVALSPAQVFLFKFKKVDPGFNDMEILHDPSNDIDLGNTVWADIVAVHGLGSTPQRAWSYGTEQTRPISGNNQVISSDDSQPRHESPIWLKDFLPTENLGVRVLAFNHNSNWESNAQIMSLRDYGQQLLLGLNRVRKTQEERSRPIIFLGYSFGGIIVKQGLVIACEQGTGDADLSRKLIQERAAGFIFLGTPHRGSKLALGGQLLSIFGYWAGSSVKLLEFTDPESSGNNNLHDSFMRLFRDRKIVTFFETVAETWNGFSITPVVSRASASIDGYDTIPLPSRHRDIHKYKSKSDTGYLSIRQQIEILVDEVSKEKKSALQEASKKSEEQLQETSPEELECLQSLSFPNINSRWDGIEFDSVEENSCLWLHEKFAYWFAAPRGLFWIQGGPGAGKSTLMKDAVKRAKKKPAYPDSLVISFFFHGRGDELQKTKYGLFRSLLHQLLSEDRKSLIEFNRKEFKARKDKHGEFGQKWTWHEGELREVLIEAVRDLLVLRPVQIYIDAIDEAGRDAAQDLMELFHKFRELNSPTRLDLSICFTCRLYPIMNWGEADGLVCKVEDFNRDAIKTFVRSKLGNVRQKKENEIQKLGDTIMERNSGIFQWIVLVVGTVCNCLIDQTPFEDIMEKVRAVPSELSRLYESMIKVSDKADTLLLMQWVCFATRPLTLVELRYAMAFDAEPPPRNLRNCEIYRNFTDEEMRFRIRFLSAGLVEERNGVVQGIHQSVNDFFVETGIGILSPSDSISDCGEGHKRLRRSCVKYLGLQELGQSIAGADDADSSDEDEAAIEKTRFPFLRYAATSWVLHAEKAEAEEIAQEDLLNQFQWPDNSIIATWVTIYNRIDKYSNGHHPPGTVLIHVAARHGLYSVITTLMEKTLEVEPKDGNSRTPLSWAAENGHESVVKLLLEKAVDVDSKDENGRTPLSWAVRNRHESVVKLLLEKAVDVDSKDENGQTPLSWAVENGHESVVKLLLEKAVDVDSKDTQYGQTPLFWAARDGHESVVKLLLEKAVDVDSKDTQYGRTPLSWAVRNRHESVVKLLLEKAVDVDSKDENGRTPLSWAARDGHESVVKLLLEKAVDVDSKDTQYGQTPLSWAARDGHESVVKLLLEKAVDVDSKDTQYGQTPLSWAARDGHESVVKLLLEKAVDVDSKDTQYGQTPLSWAARNGHESVVKLLLEKAVDVDSKDENGRTPLSWAVRNRHESVVKLLLEKAVDVDSKDENGRTPLSWAVRNRHESVVKLLLEKAVDVDSKDENGQTPLFWAIENGHESVV